MPRWLAASFVFLAAFLFLSYGIDRWSIAGPYVDEKGRIASQDEAVYSHVAIRMAESGDWLTPHFLDRFFLTKPPLLYWLSGVSVKLLGVSTFALRMPSLIAGALGVMIVFLWVSDTRPWWTALIAAAALLTHDLWFRLSRLNLTDALLSLWFVAALWLLPRSAWITGSLCGLAILTKGLAGLMPLIAVGAVLLIQRNWRRGVQVAGVAALVAAPWHLYQYFVHQRWFYAEYIGVEILRYALGAPPQTSQESTAVFYFGRFLSLFAVVGFAGLVWTIRQRDWNPALALALMVIAAVFAYQYRNLAYWMPLAPALAILAGRSLPWYLLPFMLAWPARDPAMTPVTPVLRAYCAMNRPNELVLISTADEFHATVLPLPHVRYVFVAAPPEYGSAMLDFRALGITQTVDDYLAETKPRESLREWGLPNERALATVLLAQDQAGVDRLMAARPDWDFLVNGELRLSTMNSKAGIALRRSCRL